MVLFVGYQAVGTLGRLLDGLKKGQAFNDEIEVHAQITAARRQRPCG